MKVIRGDMLLKRLPQGPLTGVEVGVYHGELAAYLLRKRPDLRLTMIDPWAQPYATKEDQAKAEAATEFAKDRRIIITEPSPQCAWRFPNQILDFCFIDGGHDYDAVIADLFGWLYKVKPGGWLCGHDYESKGKFGVKKAVDEFAKGCGMSVEPDQNRTWFIRIPEC